MPKLTKVEEPTKKRGRPKGSKKESKVISAKEEREFDKQTKRMYTFQCPICKGIAKSITKNAEFICGIDKGVVMELL